MLVDQILHGDCLDIMPTIPDASVDMVLADLPYGVTQNQWDKVIPLDRLWHEYRRVTRPNAAVVLTATQPFAAQLVASNPRDFRYDLIWRKNKSTGFLNANRMPLRQHESILVFYRRLPVYHLELQFTAFTRWISPLPLLSAKLSRYGAERVTVL